jgi:hypothetical protein
MNTVPTMTYVWLYVSEGAGNSLSLDAVAQLAGALSIPNQQVFAGNNVTLNDRLQHMQQSMLLHFPVQGDFSYSCDTQLSGWTQPGIEAALGKLSASGLTIAMLDNADASPFACILFQTGSRRAATVVEDDETNNVTLYPQNHSGVNPIS